MTNRNSFGSSSATNFIALLAIMATVIIGLVAVRATVGTASWGGVPPKSLQANYIGPTDPLEDLSNAESHLSISVRSDGKEVRNLRIVQATLENNGPSPILSNDMFEPLSLKSDVPWRIVRVANQATFGDAYIKLKWQKVSDSEFRADPILLNPGDRVSATVYMTWDGDGSIPKLEQAPLRWYARISNLKQIDREPDIFSRIDTTIPIWVTIWGWGVPFFLFSFFVYNALSVLLLVRVGAIRVTNIRSLFLVPVVAILNICAADAGTTYTFGTNMFLDLPVDGAENLPPLLLNAALLIALGLSAWRRSRALRVVRRGENSRSTRE